LRSRRTHATASDTQDQEDLVTTAREEEHIAVRAARCTLGPGDPAMLDREGRHTLARVVAHILAPAALCTADPEDLPTTVLEVSLIPVLEVPLIPVLVDHASQDRADPATQALVAETPAPGFAGRSHAEIPSPEPDPLGLQLSAADRADAPLAIDAPPASSGANGPIDHLAGLVDDVRSLIGQEDAILELGAALARWATLPNESATVSGQTFGLRLLADVQCPRPR
jgi:hypothetical protein